jgi:flagellar basal-body rod modification protein FlgD
MIGSVASSDFATSLTQAQNRAAVSREQFLQILVTELTSQDPMEPLDNSEFMQQLVGLQTLEQTAALTDSLRSFERFMSMSTAATMIGKTVKGTVGGSTIQGVVDKVVMDKDGVQLMVGSKKLPVSAVQEILAGAP